MDSLALPDKIIAAVKRGHYENEAGDDARRCQEDDSFTCRDKGDGLRLCVAARASILTHDWAQQRTKRPTALSRRRVADSCASKHACTVSLVPHRFALWRPPRP